MQHSTCVNVLFRLNTDPESLPTQTCRLVNNGLSALRCFSGAKSRIGFWYTRSCMCLFFYFILSCLH